MAYLIEFGWNEGRFDTLCEGRPTQVGYDPRRALERMMQGGEFTVFYALGQVAQVLGVWTGLAGPISAMRFRSPDGLPRVTR